MRFPRAIAAATCGVVLLAACRDSNHRPPPAAVAPESAPSGSEATGPAAPAPSTAPVTPLPGLASLIVWSPELTLRETGPIGTDSSRAAWFRLEAGQLDPAAALRAALGSLARVAGPGALKDINDARVTADGSATAVAQIRGPRLAAAITAARRGTTVELRVVAQRLVN